MDEDITTRIERATIEDADAIVAVQHAAFGKLARDFGVKDMPPLRENADDLRAMFADHVFLKAVGADGRVVGSVRGRLDEHGTVHLGRLVVDPDASGRGIATRLCTELEAAYPDARRFELFTADSAEGPLHIYRKLGYVLFRTVKLPDERFKLVYLEKMVGGEGFKPPTSSV